MIDDSDDSDLDSLEDENETGGGMSIMGGESIISAKDLIDNNLTELLNTMKKFPPPTSD